MTTNTDNDELAALLLDGSWIDETRQAVADGFACGVCLDFGYLDGLGPCPHCDPDGYAEHAFYAAQEHRTGIDGIDPWPGTGKRADILWDAS